MIEGADRRAGIWANRDFGTILVGQGVSNLGDGVSGTALPLLVLLLSHSGTQMGIVGVLETIPTLLFGPVSGALSDRWDRRRTMLLCDLGRALLTALIPLSALLPIPTMAVVFAVTAPIGLLRDIFRAAYAGCIPNLVSRDQIARANSYFEGLESFSWIIGPAIAGVLVAGIGPRPTLLVDAVSFLVSALSLALVRTPLQAGVRERGEGLLREIREGAVYVLEHAVLRSIAGLWGLTSIVVSTIVPVIAFVVTITRHLPVASVGVVVAAYAAGSLLGTLLAGHLAIKRLGRGMLVAEAFMGLSLLVLMAAGALPILLAGAFAYGLGEGLVLIWYLTLRTTSTPDRLLGRVASISRTVSGGLSTLGLACVGFLLDRIGGTGTLIVLSVLLFSTSVLFSASHALRATMVDASDAHA